jgi:uncharacterized membrane protein YidH (DUF202 family)
MKFLNGLGLGLMISGVAFWCFVISIQPLKAPNYKLLALIFVVIESIITFVGIGISVYVMWKWKQ